MEIQIKKAIKAGNSSAVILPRTWLNKEVRIELIKKNSETILMDVIGIAKKNIPLKSIIGIYLVGSYAREEEDKSSDIDVLIITDNIDKEIIREGIYNLLIISSDLLKQKLNQDLFPVGQMIKEAKPLFNSSYLNLIEVKATSRNTKWYLDTTEEKLRIIEEIIENLEKPQIQNSQRRTQRTNSLIHSTPLELKSLKKFPSEIENYSKSSIKKTGKEYLDDKIAYTLILRIRTMNIIKNLVKGRKYSKKEFVRLIKRISNGTNAYEGYIAVKNNIKREQGVSLEEVKKLYEYLKNELIKVKRLIKKLI